MIEITEINSFKLKLSGDPAILVIHMTDLESLALLHSILSQYKINIGHMEVARKDKGDTAIMVIEVDEKIEERVIE